MKLVGEVSDGEAPCGMVAGEELGDVLPGHVGELLAPFVRRHPAVRPHRTEQGASERTGPDPGLDDVGAGEHVGHRHDLGGILGVDHGRAPRHGDDELGEQRAEDEVLPSRRRRDREPFLAPDQLVVVEVAAVGEEPLAGLETDVVPPSLAVGQPDPLPRPERAAMDTRPCLGRDVVDHDGNPTDGSPGTPGRRRRW
jgi:hypothetical protein